MSAAEPSPVTFTLAGAVRGARAILPIAPGAVAFGLVYGFSNAEFDGWGFFAGVTSRHVRELPAMPWINRIVSSPSPSRR